MLCITVAKDDKWANVIASKVIGVSRHLDYAVHHWKAKDVKALKLPLSKFIFVNADGIVDEVILADQLAARGCNFKTAKRDSHPLTEEEQREIATAIELVQGATSGVAQVERTAGQQDEQRSTELAQGDALGQADAPSESPSDAAPPLHGTETAVEPAAATAAELTAQLGGAEVEVPDDDSTPAIKESRLLNRKKRR